MVQCGFLLTSAGIMVSATAFTCAHAFCYDMYPKPAIVSKLLLEKRVTDILSGTNAACYSRPRCVPHARPTLHTATEGAMG